MIDQGLVEEEGARFALEVMETLARVLPSGNLGFTSVARTVGSEAYVSISQAEDLGLELTVHGRPLARLVVEYRCRLSEVRKMLMTMTSSYKLFVGESNFPVFAFDYVKDARANTPAAHWNVYANRQDVSESLRRAGAQRRGSTNRRAARDGRTGIVGEMHFPVGGHRFRPCLEDVLDMVWSEYGIDTRPTARAAIDEGRRRWRQIQLKAAVSDDPSTAAEELRRLGISVPDLSASLSERLDRTTAI